MTESAGAMPSMAKWTAPLLFALVVVLVIALIVVVFRAAPCLFRAPDPPSGQELGESCLEATNTFYRGHIELEEARRATMEAAIALTKTRWPEGGDSSAPLVAEYRDYISGEDHLLGKRLITHRDEILSYSKKLAYLVDEGRGAELREIERPAYLNSTPESLERIIVAPMRDLARMFEEWQMKLSGHVAALCGDLDTPTCRSIKTKVRNLGDSVLSLKAAVNRKNKDGTNTFIAASLMQKRAFDKLPRPYD